MGQQRCAGVRRARAACRFREVVSKRRSVSKWMQERRCRVAVSCCAAARGVRNVPACASSSFPCILTPQPVRVHPKPFWCPTEAGGTSCWESACRRLGVRTSVSCFLTTGSKEYGVVYEALYSWDINMLYPMQAGLCRRVVARPLGGPGSRPAQLCIVTFPDQQWGSARLIRPWERHCGPVCRHANM